MSESQDQRSTETRRWAPGMFIHSLTMLMGAIGLTISFAATGKTGIAIAWGVLALGFAIMSRLWWTSR